MATKYAKNVMLVGLSLPIWQGSATDKNLGDDVETRNQMQKGMARVHKQLFARKSVPEYAKLRNAMSACRNYHLSNTVPSQVEGFRTRPTAGYEEYRGRINQLMDDVRYAASEFQAVYPDVVAGAPAVLGSAFNAADYPAASTIAGRFEPTLTILPYPIPEHFEAEVGADQEAIRQSIVAGQQAAMKEIVFDLFGRLRTVLKDVKDQLSQQNCRLSERSKNAMARVFETVQALDPAVWADAQSSDPALKVMVDTLKKEVGNWDTKAINKGGVEKLLAQNAVEETLKAVNDKLKGTPMTKTDVIKQTAIDQGLPFVEVPMENGQVRDWATVEGLPDLNDIETFINGLDVTPLTSPSLVEDEDTEIEFDDTESASLGEIGSLTGDDWPSPSLNDVNIPEIADIPTDPLPPRPGNIDAEIDAMLKQLGLA